MQHYRRKWSVIGIAVLVTVLSLVHSVFGEEPVHQEEPVLTSTSQGLNHAPIKYPDDRNRIFFDPEPSISGHPEIKTSYHVLTSEMVIQEIQALEHRLDLLQQQDLLSSSTRIVAGAVLTTIVYGLLHAEIIWMFHPRFYSETFPLIRGASAQINAVLNGLFYSIVPGFAIGELMLIANTIGYYPHLDPMQMVTPAAIATVVALGLSLLGAQMNPVYNLILEGNFGGKLYWAAHDSLPIVAMSLFRYILSKRAGLHAKVLHLKKQLIQRRKALPDTMPQAEVAELAEFAEFAEFAQKYPDGEKPGITGKRKRTPKD